MILIQGLVMWGGGGGGGREEAITPEGLEDSELTEKLAVSIENI